MAMDNPSHRKRSLPLSPVKSDLSSNLIPSLPLSSSKKISSEASQKKDNTMNWICMECKEADAMEDLESELLLCEGPCHRVFHQICVGLSTIPSDAWYCTDCRNETHACAICHVYGTDNVDVFLCSHKFCGLWYHESCLSMCHVEIHHPNIEQSLLQRQQSSKFDVDNCKPESDETFANDYDLLPKREFQTSSPEFKCPAHRCWTCSEDMIVIDDDKEDTQKEGSRSKKRKSKSIKDNDFGVKTGNLFRCLECPIAYHISCISPFAKFHELALLCHEHAATFKLPYLDLSASFQGKLELAADKKIESMKQKRKRPTLTKTALTTEQSMSNVFFLGLKGDSISKEEGVMLTQVRAFIEKHETDKVTPQLLDLKFCLPCDLKDEVYSKLPSFRFIHTLRYDPNNRPKRKQPSGECCQCSQIGVCDESCFNRIMGLECTGDASKVNGSKNPFWNCDVGTNCGNRALGLRQSVKCKPQREQGKGWGLVTLEKVKKGSLVQEYVGEVIDDQTKNERLQIWSREHPNDPNFYIMHLEAGWFIDARFEANLSRFINHSCDPNCVLRPVNVAGFTRNGIFAARDLEPGEFLSYDYQFDTRYGDKFQCRCGSKNCRGTMKGGKQQLIPDDDKKTLKQALAAAKNREEKDRKFLEEMQRLQEERFSQVDAMVPGAEYPGETVALGPHERHKKEAITQRILLWRNCRAGGNFWNRVTRLDQEKELRGLKQDKSILTKESTIDLVTQLKMMAEMEEEQCALGGEATLGTIH